MQSSLPSCGRYLGGPSIVQDIFTLIFRAQVVVVDFTGKNPNVMYETGIAHTLGKHVVPISQSVEDVPFDMRHHRVLKYLPNAEGLTKLYSDLSDLRFPLDKPIPYALISKIVKFRVKENLERAEAKGKKR